jgi:hypothetical protein
MKSKIPVMSLSSDEATDIAADAYFYGFPLVLMDVTRQVMTAVARPDGRKAPMNQFAHNRAFPDPTATDVVNPNSDTLYSAAWLDLSREPMVLSVPAMQRYYVLQMLDAWTNVFASAGTRATGNGKEDFAIVGPSWRGKPPYGLKPIHSPTRFVLVAGRTQTNGEGDYAAVNMVQDQYTLTPLSAWGRPYTPPRGTPFEVGINVTATPLEQVMQMDACAFFSHLANLLKENPPAMADSITLGRFAAIGVAPGKHFELNTFGTAVGQAIETGMTAARTKLVAEARKLQGKNVNGWDILPDNAGNFGTDYECRAYVAFQGLGANLSQDSISLNTMIDTQGRPLNGRNNYVLRFQKGQAPPVNAFWSITAYNTRQCFIPNAMNRYAIGDRNKLKVNADGSLTLHFGNTSPAPEAESNWLPAGTDYFNLTMRLYWPKHEAVSGIWRVPGVERLHN